MDSSSPEPSAFQLQIPQGAIDHVVAKHVRDRLEGPLWTEALSPHTNLESLFRLEIPLALARPLYVEYEQYDLAGRFLHSTREVVTRLGFIAVVRLLDADEGELITAYFPAETFEESPRRRWLAACRSRIEVYGSTVTYGLACREVTPPDPSEVFPSTDPPGERRVVCFVNDIRWGICSEDVNGTILRVFKKPPPWPVT